MQELKSLSNATRVRTRHPWMKAAGAAVLLLALAVALPAQGATILWKAPNAAIYLGLPSTQLEFENPLAGTETVLSHAVLDWRDADYNKSGHPLYDDWNVFLNGGTINGDLNEIWMRKAGQYIRTTTLVPSQIISIHMTGDNNDGLADVLVDGTSPTFALLKAAGWEMELKRPKTCHKLDVEPIDMLHERTCMYLNVKSTVSAIGSRPNLFGTLPAVARSRARSCWGRRHPHLSRIWAPRARWARAASATWGP